MTKTIPVIEIFGPTIQGEGQVIGQKTMFVRTAGCDYRCAWCDSAFTWDGSARHMITKLTAEEILQQLKAIGGDRFNHVTISGGNPALYAEIGELIQLLTRHGIKTAVETQGSRWQPWFNDVTQLTLSPKPPSARVNQDVTVFDDIIRQLRSKARLHDHVNIKVVIFDEEDFTFAQKLHQRYKDVPFFLQVGNDELEDDELTKLQQNLLLKLEWLIEKVTASPEMNDVRVLPQLHTLLWGNKRGV